MCFPFQGQGRFILAKSRVCRVCGVWEVWGVWGVKNSQKVDSTVPRAFTLFPYSRPFSLIQQTSRAEKSANFGEFPCEPIPSSSVLPQSLTYDTRETALPFQGDEKNLLQYFKPLAKAARR